MMWFTDIKMNAEFFNALVDKISLCCLHCILSFFSKIFIYLLIFGCAGSSLLSSLSLVVTSGGYSLVVVHRLLILVASLVVELGL